MRTEVLRYLAVGVLNKATGLSAIWGLMLLGVAPIAANLGGYLIGLCVAFVLYRRWAFRVGSTQGQVLRFALAFAVAYGINVAALSAGLALFDARGFLAQLPALAAYTVSFYFLNKFYVFAAVGK